MFTYWCLSDDVGSMSVFLPSTFLFRCFARPNVKVFNTVAIEDRFVEEGRLNMNAAEDNSAHLIREVVSGMIVTGMEITEIDRAPRMGEAELAETNRGRQPWGDDDPG
ncbi:hypothetical protein C4D60_Mb04t31230 [Musa balbisiana]|uniref:Uncharacterized protein n=1 Tax=Musa balbisiana TaxID=52838 RepID=A0A4V4HA58_MUSBA|nr:hypothetical protein C4D60_Mb04t31230 [Musa balbisiana]